MQEKKGKQTILQILLSCQKSTLQHSRASSLHERSLSLSAKAGSFNSSEKWGMSRPNFVLTSFLPVHKFPVYMNSSKTFLFICRRFLVLWVFQGMWTDAGELPRMLVIGDSISINYTPMVRERLAGQVEVHHIGTNGAHTRKGLQHLDAWLGEEPWTLIHFNWGLHDLRNRGNGHAVPLKEYAENLEKLADRLQQTGAHLIWASTTPVPQGSRGRNNQDAVAYNATALKIMRQKGIDVHDLYAAVLPHREAWMREENVHFHERGYEALADHIAARVREHLAPGAAKAAPEAAPEIHILFPDDDDTLGPDITVRVRVKAWAMQPGGAGYRLYLNDQPTGVYHTPDPVTLEDLPAGRHHLRAVRVNTAGEESGTVDRRVFTVE